MGQDTFWKDSVPAEYPTYFRVLESTDEYFPYHKKYHAYWAMYGMGLPDAIPKKSLKRIAYHPKYRQDFISWLRNGCGCKKLFIIL